MNISLTELGLTYIELKVSQNKLLVTQLYYVYIEFAMNWNWFSINLSQNNARSVYRQKFNWKMIY